MSSGQESGDTTPASRYRVEHYGNTRNWAVYEGGRLLNVSVYKKGAESFQRELETRDAVIAEQAAQIEQLTALLSPPAAPMKRFQDRVWPEANGQLGFFSKAEKERYTTARRGPSRGRS